MPGIGKLPGDSGRRAIEIEKQNGKGDFMNVPKAMHGRWGKGRFGRTMEKKGKSIFKWTVGGERKARQRNRKKRFEAYTRPIDDWKKLDGRRRKAAWRAKDRLIDSSSSLQNASGSGRSKAPQMFAFISNGRWTNLHLHRNNTDAMKEHKDN